MTCGTLVSKELCECLASLKESVHESYRNKHLRKRHLGTCTWIFSNKHYRCWLQNDDHLILWIYGGPGFGKSVLSEVLSKELISSQHTSFDQEYSVAYFFCDDKDDLLKTSYALLSNVLAQLLRQDPNTLIHFSNEPDYNINKEKTVWTFEKLWRVFGRIVIDENLKPMIVIIDALGMLSSYHASFYGCPVQHRVNSVQMSARRKHAQRFYTIFSILSMRILQTSSESASRLLSPVDHIYQLNHISQMFWRYR
jgi:hypothetical protein